MTLTTYGRLLSPLFVLLAASPVIACDGDSSADADDVDPPASCPEGRHATVVCGQLGDVDQCVRYEGVCLRACTPDEASSTFCKDRGAGECPLGGFSVGEAGHCWK